MSEPTESQADPLDEACRLHDLAVERLAERRLEDAEQLGRQALAIFERESGPDHPDVANILLHLGAVQDENGRGAEAAKEIEHGELRVPHRVLDVVPEDPQEPHVADQVQPPAMHEHGREQRDVPRLGIHDAGQAARDRHAAAGRRRPQQLARYQPQLAHRPGQRDRRAQTLREDPRQHVQRDDPHRDVRRQYCRVLVLVRNHESESTVSAANLAFLEGIGLASRA